MSSHAAYALLAVPFLAVAVVVAVTAGVVAARRARAAGRPSGPGRRVALVGGLIAAVVLLVMTIVFDNVIVTLRVVAYDPSLISGAKIGAIPVEDLAYSIGAVLLLPALWVLLDRPSSTAPPARPSRDAPGARPSAEGEPTP
ncbi:lycopene cyclase domain-containing protein [Curtobacterium sp. SP.BCp]|uniref:lycopene cyclase domain-containing protein n=1 Tax=unclassified Curtobacterium TaxID=257496 RepID=UPI0025B4797E|nr:lycopene cyclase domain-containing protein [Curtobacterium sp. 458]WJY00615.1 lycopene cyclase domain-containing protein [Curtobacterium sp. 458]